MRKLIIVLTGILLFTGQLMAQTRRTVTGKVTDESGNPVPSATIQIEGTRRGTVTDAMGNFILNLPENARTLVVSLIGMNDKKVEIGRSATLSITLVPSASSMNEVVVVGYGSAKNAGTVVGSVDQVSGKQIQDRPTANALDALQGQVAGLQVFTSSGEPSQTSSFRIHGVGSLGASSTPLVVMDGIPIDPDNIITLNPQDFENITVLKDAAATSIYGSRAANGVIYITTKKGKSGQEAVINLKSQYGITRMMNNKFFDNFMSSKELTDFWVDIGYRTRQQVDDLLATYPHNTRWDKVYYKDDAPFQQHNLNISGGGGKTTYFVSGGYLKQEGLAYRSGYERYTMRANITSTVNNWMRFGINTSGGYDKQETNPYGGSSSDRGLAFMAPPYYSIYDKNGHEYPDLIPGLGRYHPKYLADKNRSKSNSLLLNLSGYIEVNPVKNLTLKTQAGLEASDSRTSSVRLPSYLGSLNNGSASESFSRTVSRTITNTAEYRFRVADDHNITALAGQEYIDHNSESFNGSSSGQTDDRLILISSGPANRNAGSSKSEYAYLSCFGRLEYNFLEKYFIDLSIRQDQSSRFGRDNRTANFWSAGAMWRASREDFLKDVSWLKDLTVRASYGTSGNSAIGNYESLPLVGITQYGDAPGWGISAPGNPMLSWESQKQANLGLSFGLFDRANIEVEYYNRTTKNMLMDVPLPYTSGFGAITENVGALKNTGIDMTVSVDVYRTKKAYITPWFNFNYNRNKVAELFQGKQYWNIPNTGVTWVVGQPVSYFYPVFARINPQTGLPEWYLPDDIVNPRRDKNAVTTDFDAAALQQNTGIQRYAPFTGGFGLKAGYDGFYLQADFSFVQGKYMINNDRYFSENPRQFAGDNQSKNVLDHWKKPGDVARFPKNDVQVWTQFDTRLIENASFMRMKLLTLGYNFSPAFLRKTGFFKGAGIYLTGRNLLTVTKYSGADPENDSNLSLGRNPNTRQYTAGVNLQF